MEIVLGIVKAVGWLFANPLLYIAILMSMFLGYRRVKRERRFFHIRLLHGKTELLLHLKVFLLSGVVSLLLAAGGVVLPRQLLIVLTMVSIVLMLTYFYHLLSPVVSIAVAASILIGFYYADVSFSILSVKIGGFSWTDEAVVTACIVAGVLVIAEGMLVKRWGVVLASPVVEKTRRGLQAVSFLSKGLWVLPIFVVVPGHVVEAFMPYWPQFTLGAETLSFVVFPFVVGFQQLTRKTLPVYFYPRMSRTILLLGQVIVISGLVGYFYPLVASITLAVGAFIRLFIGWVAKWEERKDVYAVAPNNAGVMIAAVLPNSPAQKMGLVAGEIIRRINGQEVKTEQELYAALQINAAHCKLEVLDHRGELRLTQHVVHSEDHYQIGVILI